MSTHSRRLAIAAAFVGLPLARAAAQAPVITPAGDPSVRSDTIYSLAVKPEDHPEDPYVYLLDDGVVKLEADGRVTRTYRQVIQVLTREGAERWGEMSFSYAPERERMTVNWVRVLSTDGHVIADSASHQQESRVPVAEEAPVYTDRMERRMTLGGVAPGSIVDYSVTTEVLQPLVPGDYYGSWSVKNGRLTRRSRYIVDVPANLHLDLKETNVHGSRPEVRDGRRIMTWAAADVPKLESEPFAIAPDTVEETIEFSLPRHWSDIGRFYDSLAADRYAIDTTLGARIADVVKDARTREDTLRALHRWVAQDFRYVSLSLGRGGYQPRTPASVIETRYGDCKDKATLFVAAARHLGFHAWPVLLSASGSADSTMPSVEQFDHAIAAVEWPGHVPYLYLDLTSELTPFGELPPDEQNGFALVVKDRSHIEQVLLPRAAIGENRTEMRVDGVLNTDGTFNGHFTRHDWGSRQYQLREAFSETPSSEARAQFIRSLAGAIFEDASGDSLVTFDGRDLRAPVQISLAVHGGRAVRSQGGIDMLTLPLQNFGNSQGATDLAARPARKWPIDRAAVTPPSIFDDQFTLLLPEGWHARLPHDVKVESSFGSYEATYRQDGRNLQVRRVLTGARGTEPPDHIADVVAFIRAVSQDDTRQLVLDHTNP